MHEFLQGKEKFIPRRCFGVCGCRDLQHSSFTRASERNEFWKDAKLSQKIYIKKEFSHAENVQWFFFVRKKPLQSRVTVLTLLPET
jgi:hypothetical protein